MANIAHPATVPARWRPLRHLPRRTHGAVLGAVVISGAVLLGIRLLPARRALVLAERALHRVASLGPSAIVVALVLLAATLVLVAVTTERQFSRTDEWYDGH